MAFSPIVTLERIVEPEPIEAPFLHDRALHLPIFLGLQFAVGGRGPRITVVDKRHSVPDEDIVFDGHAFADKGVAGNLAALAHVAFFWISTKAPILVSSPISQP